MMIQSPGLVRREQIPKWTGKIQIMLETGWTQQQYDDQPIETIREMLTFLRGRSRGYEQLERRNRNRR